MIRKIVLLILIVMFVLPGFSRTYKGVTMQDKITIEGTELVLNGMALRKKFIFKVYVAGLYLPAKEKDAKKILKADQIRKMVMHWLRSVGTGKINDGWMDGLEDNTPNFSPELKKQFEKLCAMMEDVKDGNLIVFTYIPAKGTEVKVKGKVKGTIEGKPFADALLGCWIGPDPGPGSGFKEDILGID